MPVEIYMPGVKRSVESESHTGYHVAIINDLY
jgi:hypothetical protein